MALVALGVVGVAAWRGWPHLRFWWQFERLGRNAQGCPEFRHRSTGIVFVRVPGGRFLMGSPESEAEREDDEGPVHEVERSPFLIAKCEVSQAEWERVLGSNPSNFKGRDLPVEHVSWDDCQEFCRKTGLKLPTEAQWEYACQAGTTTPFAFGETITPEQVNYNGEFPYSGGAPGLNRQTTVSVASFAPNGFGLHQMHGNVWEWCEDVYDNVFYGAPEACQKDPVSSSGPGFRVLRGGRWYYGARNCRSADRGRGGPANRDGDVGFRPAFFPLP